MLTSIPASNLNQNKPDLGIQIRLSLISSRSRVIPIQVNLHRLFNSHHARTDSGIFQLATKEDGRVKHGHDEMK